MALLDERGHCRYEDAMPPMLELPMVDESAAKQIMKELREANALTLDGMKARQRLPSKGTMLRKRDEVG